MHKTVAETEAFLDAFLPSRSEIPGVEILLIPPFTNLETAHRRLAGSPIRLGAQDVHAESSGAFTGSVSAEMVAGVGCRHVLVGHSERRHVFGDDNDTVHRKLIAALRAKLEPILCVGETIEQRRGGETTAIVEQQLSTGLDEVDRATMAKIVIAYEPVWAIGTGETATPEQAQEACAGIRAWVAQWFDAPTAEGSLILYGGSVKPSNAAELLAEPDIDGALVGGASLDPEAFRAIVDAAEPQ